MTKPFIKPSVLHPHIVHETGKENPQHMYEVSNDIFAAIGKDPLRGVSNDQQVQTGSTGIVGFIKDHPILSAIIGIGIGAAGYAAFSGRAKNPSEDDLDREVEFDDNGDIIDAEVVSSSTRPRVRNAGNAPVKVQLALPAPQFSQPQIHYVTNPGTHEPIVIKTKEQPPVTVTMPSEKGVEVSMPGILGTGSSAGVVKKRRRRKKPERVQVRDQSGKFTSTTVRRAIPAGYSQKKEQVK